MLTCNGQAAAGYQVTLIVGDEHSEVMRAALDPRVDFVVEPGLTRSIDPRRDLAALFRLWRRFRLSRTDIVHTHTSKAGIIGRLAARLAGVPLIVHGVHILPFVNVSRAETMAYTWLERFCGAFTDAFVHVSAGMRDACLAGRVGPRANHVVAESGMDVARFRGAALPEDAETLRASPVGIEEPAFLLLSMAALEPRKGQRAFLHVLRSIVDVRPNVRLLIAGEGADRQAIEAAAEALGLAAHVVLLGHRRDPERLLAIADAVVICSSREGLPRVAVQAAIAGTPIVTTALPGIEAVVADGRTGFIVPVDRLDLMAAPILELIDDPAIRARMGAALGERDYSAWDAERMVGSIERVYEAARARRGGRTGRAATT